VSPAAKRQARSKGRDGSRARASASASVSTSASASAAAGRKPRGRCLIVGYDRSDSARLAVSWAASQLGEGDRIVLVHSCRSLHVPASPLKSARERRELGQALLDELLLVGPASLLETVSDTEVSDEDPVSALTAAARRYDASGIVVGREEHSRLHAAIGTVTRELLMRSPVPVTVVPPAETPVETA
jgi:nucleotide-binding universal stress UspA family protein